MTETNDDFALRMRAKRAGITVEELRVREREEAELQKRAAAAIRATAKTLDFGQLYGASVDLKREDGVSDPRPIIAPEPGPLERLHDEMHNEYNRSMRALSYALWAVGLIVAAVVWTLLR